MPTLDTWWLRQFLICCTGVGDMLTFFFDRSDDFSEIRDFVKDMDERYQLHVQSMHGDFKGGLEQLVNAQGIKAIFLGTRRCAALCFKCWLLPQVIAGLQYQVPILPLFINIHSLVLRWDLPIPPTSPVADCMLQL